MRFRRHADRRWAACIGLVTLTSVGACDRAATSPIAPTPVAPVIVSILPANLSTSDRPQTLKIAGSQFLPGASITIRGPAGESTVLTGSLIQPVADGVEISVTLASPGEYWLVASNGPAAPATRVPLEVAARVKPWIADVTPDPLVPGAQAQVVTVTGSGFAPGIFVTLVNGLDVTIIGDDSIGQVTATSFTLRHAFAKPGAYALNLVTPAGDPSNTVTVVVK